MVILPDLLGKDDHIRKTIQFVGTGRLLHEKAKKNKPNNSRELCYQNKNKPCRPSYEILTQILNRFDSRSQKTTVPT